MRLFLVLFLVSVALLPWSWVPPFPWLHERAQWSDAALAAAAVLWVLERWRSKAPPKLHAAHAAMAAYLVVAGLSHVAAGFEPVAGSLKLLGIAGLVVLAVISGDVASRPGGLPAIARVIAWTSLAMGTAALLGVGLFHAGVPTLLVAHAGDLEPGNYARARAGFPLPNGMASFTIVAVGIVSHPEARLPRGLRLAAQIALGWGVVSTMARGVLGFVLALLVGRAHDAGGRRRAKAWAAVSAALLLLLTVWNVALNPLKPWVIHLRQEPSSRWAAVTSSLTTVGAAPLLGTGPGTLSGERYGAPCDAHLTPLNIAATLGLPALGCFMAIPWLLWRRRRRPTDLAVWGVIAGLALDALAQDVEDFRHLWLAFGLAARDGPITGPNGRASPRGCEGGGECPRR